MDRPPYSLGQLIAYFLGLGTYGFGGPVALVGYMQRDLVERRGWIAEADYREGMALAQLAPGPLAAQLAIYIGYVHYGVLGATLVGLAFVLPSFLMVLALGWAYVQYGGLNWMRAVFYGIGPAVIGIIAYSAYKLTRKTIGKDWLLWLVYLASAVATIITQRELVWLVLASGLLVWLVKTPPRLGSTAAFALPLGLSAPVVPVASNQTLWQIAVFFTEAGAFVFGSGLAIIPFLYGGVVTHYGWLNDDQFLDAVAVAMITPGPVVITVAFIGYLVAGLNGATIAAVATFLPCYFFTILPAPYFRKYGKRPGIVAFVDGVTAAAIGAISGAVVVLGQRMIVDEGRPDLFKVGLMLATLAIYSTSRKIPEPLLVLAAALVGLAAYPVLH
ncbi:MAG TPA: chromate transporter [Lacipirellulaceae bacterium]|nr:chromate transporter [Lacipirellulaceae bacterium]